MPPMAILKEKQTRGKPKAERVTRNINALSLEECANVRRAIGVLRIRLGGLAAVATALGLRRNTVEHMASRQGKPGAGVALRVARLAQVTVEDVLSGAFPKPGSCPMCGLGGD